MPTVLGGCVVDLLTWMCTLCKVYSQPYMFHQQLAGSNLFFLIFSIIAIANPRARPTKLSRFCQKSDQKLWVAQVHCPVCDSCPIRHIENVDHRSSCLCKAYFVDMFKCNVLIDCGDSILRIVTLGENFLTAVFISLSPLPPLFFFQILPCIILTVDLYVCS